VRLEYIAADSVAVRKAFAAANAGKIYAIGLVSCYEFMPLGWMSRRERRTAGIPLIVKGKFEFPSRYT
jgi:hypothetical protein